MTRALRKLHETTPLTDDDKQALSAGVSHVTPKLWQIMDNAVLNAEEEAGRFHAQGTVDQAKTYADAAMMCKELIAELDAIHSRVLTINSAFNDPGVSVP
jgi:hypothetical protein